MSPTIGASRLPSHLTSLSSPCHLRGCLVDVWICWDSQWFFRFFAKFVGKHVWKTFTFAPSVFCRTSPRFTSVCQGNFASKSTVLLNVETLRRKHPPPFMPSALIDVPSKKIHGKSMENLPEKLQQTKAPGPSSIPAPVVPAATHTHSIAIHAHVHLGVTR